MLDKIPQLYFGAWNGRDVHALDEFFASSFTWSDPMLPCPIDDVEGAQAFLASGWEGFSDISFELIGEPLVDEPGGRVAQQWRMLATHDGDFAGTPPSGNRCDLVGVDLFTVDSSGRVTELCACYDSAALMRQLGFFDDE